jgi:hypothetical protein
MHDNTNNPEAVLGRIVLYTPSEQESESMGSNAVAGIIVAIPAQEPDTVGATAHLCLIPDKERIFDPCVVKGRAYDADGAPGTWR